MTPSRRARAAVAAAVALVAVLPFLPGLLRGRSFYFRDLALHFIPLRLFALDGLRAGELRYWNPLLHEGIPSAFPPVSYPLELLQLLWPGPAGISRELALHVPLAALAFLALAWSRGATRAGAAAGALVFALGGFALSTLNLYVYAHALAWAPLVVWALGRAARGARRDVALAALVTAVALSTFGVEVAGQAVLAGIALAVERRRPVVGRLAAALALAFALAAPVLLPLGAIVATSQRGSGFATEVVLAHSIHPLTWPQTVIAGWHGDPGNLANAWWGANFFPRGFPYVLSLYLGAASLSLAAVGALAPFPDRLRVLVLLGLAVLACLGQYGGLAPLLDVLPPLRAFRYPTKAFFTVHLLVALLAAHGTSVLERGTPATWRRLAGFALPAAAALLALGALPSAAPSLTSWFLAGFTPPDLTWVAREAVARFIVADAARGAMPALALGLLALLAAGGRLAPARAAIAAAALVAADLVRAGAGLNPHVEPSFFLPGPDVAQALPALRAGRVHTCATHDSPAYWRARAGRAGRHEAWTFATQIETLTPETNLPLGLPSALSEDFTSLLPPALVPAPGETCGAFERLEPRLRRAAVTTVLSLDPLESPALAPQATWRPERIAPLSVHVYALRDALPRHAVVARGQPPPAPEAGRIVSAADRADGMDVVADASAPAVLVIRDGWFPGWRARVNGAPAPVLRVDERHRGVPLEPGRSAVALDYRPPGLRAGVILGGVGLLAALALCAPEGWRRRALRSA